MASFCKLTYISNSHPTVFKTWSTLGSFVVIEALNLLPKLQNDVEKNLVFVHLISDICHTERGNITEWKLFFFMQKDDGGWWEGTLDGKIGWFPSNYVQAIQAGNFFFIFITTN